MDGVTADGFAVCRKHVYEALNYYVGKDVAVQIRDVGDDGDFLCSCRKQAEWYLDVVDTVPANGTVAG